MKKTLVVMAAGMGSRFGGLKQIEPVGPNGEFIIDYSIYDAKKAGFEKVVFVIKKENEEVFKETIGSRIEDKIKVAYTFQRNDDVPLGKEYLVKDRVKPWGTGHAVLCAKNEVDGGFLVINADDFYGYESFKLASDFLDKSTNEKENASITFPFCMTASKFGSVKRGVCFPKTGNIEKVIESKVTPKEDYALCEPLDGSETFKVDLDQPVAMNMFVFKYEFFKYLEEYYLKFFNNTDEYIMNNETLLTDIIREKLESKEISLVSIVSPSKWLGITYKEDLDELKASIDELVKDGVYPKRLWD